MKYRKYILAIIIVTYGTVLKADIIYLKNGRTFEGKVIAQNRKSVTIRTTKNRVHKILKTKIRRVRYQAINLNKKQKTEDLIQKRILEKKRRLALLKQRKARKEKTRLALLKKQEEEKRRNDRLKKKQETNKIAKKAIDKSSQGITKTGALWRSALIPGWGQWARGEKWNGGFIGGAMLVGGFAVYESNRILQNTANDLNTLGNPSSENTFLLTALGIGTVSSPTVAQLQNPVFAILYSQPFINQQAKLDNQFKNLQAASAVLATVYLWNLIDAWFFHPDSNATQKTASPYEQYVAESTNQSRNTEDKNNDANLQARQYEKWQFYIDSFSDDYNALSNSKKPGERQNLRHEFYFSRRIEF